MIISGCNMIMKALKKVLTSTPSFEILASNFFVEFIKAGCFTILEDSSNFWKRTWSATGSFESSSCAASDCFFGSFKCCSSCCRKLDPLFCKWWRKSFTPASTSTLLSLRLSFILSSSRSFSLLPLALLSLPSLAASLTHALIFSLNRLCCTWVASPSFLARSILLSNNDDRLTAAACILSLRAAVFGRLSSRVFTRFSNL
mmetsp:Transcript_5883/g.16486  ORF Transcript_5883/g.16486 Transcript_5883/m.16486 type:complete len:201 (+) Transcript_5883:277-879(+)